jgi:predicted transport protein
MEKETNLKTEINVQKEPKKKYYKPKKKKEILDIEVPKIGNKIHKVVNSEKPYLEYKKLITNKNVGSYSIGDKKKFRIFLDKTPNWIHRTFMKLFFGWKWNNNKNL